MAPPACYSSATSPTAPTPKIVAPDTMVWATVRTTASSLAPRSTPTVLGPASGAGAPRALRDRRVTSVLIGASSLLFLRFTRLASTDVHLMLWVTTANAMLARALLREPDLVNRLQEGTASEGICTHCNRCMPTIYSGTRCTEVSP